MEYKQIINFLDNTLNQPSKFRTKNRIEIDDDQCGTYNRNSQIKFKNSMLKSSLYDYNDAYIFVKATITITGVERPLPPEARARRPQQILQTKQTMKGIKK